MTEAEAAATAAGFDPTFVYETYENWCDPTDQACLDRVAAEEAAAAANAPPEGGDAPEGGNAPPS